MSFVFRVFDSVNLLVVFSVVVAQQTDNQTDKHAESVTYLCQFLIETDKKLGEEYKARPKGNGVAIMKMVRDYNKAMASIIKRAKDDLKIGKNFTISEAKDLIDHGGPEFINFHVDTPLLEELFALNTMSSKTLQNERQVSITLWQEFFKFYSKIPDEDDLSLYMKK